MPGSLLGNVVRRVEDPDLLTGPEHLRRQPAHRRHRPRGLRAQPLRPRPDHGASTPPRPSAPPGSLAVHTGDDLGRDRRCPRFADVNPGVARRGAGRRQGPLRRRPGRPGGRRDPGRRRSTPPSWSTSTTTSCPSVADMEAALADDAPLQFEALGSNIAPAARPATAPTRSTAPTTWSGVRMVNQRIATAPIEGNAILVAARRADGLDRLGLHPAPPHGARPARQATPALDQARSASSPRTSAAPSAARPASAPTTRRSSPRPASSAAR